MYEQPVLPVDNVYAFSAVLQAIDRELSASGAERFLGRLQGRRIRVRDFASVLDKDFLGRDARLQYEKLNDNERGQIREHYLSAVEHVPSSARDKYFKLYAYY